MNFGDMVQHITECNDDVQIISPWINVLKKLIFLMEAQMSFITCLMEG